MSAIRSCAFFDLWSRSRNQQLAFLGLPQYEGSVLTHYREGKSVGHDPEKIERVNALLGVHKSLRLLFPGNPEPCYAWISQPNLAFSGLSPAAVIEENGLMGMYLVGNYLDQKLHE